MAEIASAYVSLLPEMRGWGRRLDQQLGPQLDSAGRRGGSRFAAGMKAAIGPAAAIIGTAAVGGIIKSSIDLEASFGKTMALVAASTGAPKEAIAGLRAEAMKLGASTKFSANEAADAMLELGKAGISTSDIMGGALSGTLLLAAAGDTDLATATTIASNAMNTFNLRGKDMNKIAAALAGGANASSASVSSLGEALSQVGPGATNAGLSLQETVGVLSAFDAAGVKGSDAGTSLKTMLASLVPQTDKAAGAMRALGLKFTDSQGKFLPITNVAEQLKKSLSGLSEAQRTTALTTIFGSDASRAATVLMKEGAGGIAKYIKATKDQGAAQKLADANMSGTAGALERMSGAIETAQLALGTALAPVVVKVADYLSTTLIPAVSGFITGMQKGTGAGGQLVATLRAMWSNIATVFGFIKNNAATFTAFVGSIVVLVGVIKVWTAVQWLLNTALTANPVGVLVVGIAALVAGVVYAYTHFDKFRAVVDAAFAGIKQAVAVAMPYVKSVIHGALDFILGLVNTWKSLFTGDWKGVWEGVKQILRGAWTVLKTIVRAQLDAVVAMIRGIGPALLSAASAGFGKLKEGAQKGWDATKSYVKSLPGKISDAIGDLAAMGLHAGAELLGGLARGLADATGLSKIGSAAKKVASKIKGFFPGSPVKEGPLTSWNKGGAGKRLMQMLESGISDGESGLKKTMDRISKAIVDAQDLKKTKKGMSKGQRARVAAFNKNAKAETKEMQRAVNEQLKALTGLSRQIDTAKGQLQSLKDARSSMADQTASSISGELDLTQTGGKKLSFATVAANVSGLASRAKAFAGKLRSLLAAGIPAGLVQEVASLGTVAGSSVADALLSGSQQQIGQLASDYAGVDTYSKQIGGVVAGGMYDAGIAAQEGILRGLLDDKAIQTAADKLAGKLTKAVRKSLGIKSPSRVMQQQVGRYIPAGIAAGVDDGRKALNRQMAGLVNVPRIGAMDPADFGGGYAASTPMVNHFNVTAPAGVDEPSMARLVANQMMWKMTS